MNDKTSELDSIARDERWDELASLVDDRFFAYLLDAPEALLRTMESAPEAWMRDHPRYLFARSIARGAQHSLGVIDDRDFAFFRDWVSAQRSPATRDVLGVMHGPLRHLLANGRIKEASDTASRILATIDQATDTSGFHDVLAPVLIRSGTAKLLAGDLPTAITSYSEAWRWARVRPGHPYERVARWYLAIGHALGGNYARADRELAEAPLDDTGVRASVGGDVYAYARALIAIGRVDREEAHEWVEQAAAVSGAAELGWMRVHIRARNALFWGAREHMVHEIEDYLVTHRMTTRPGTVPGDQLRADLADLYQALGNLPAAEHVLAVPGIRQAHRSVLTSRSRLSLLKGDQEQALADLAEAEHSTGGRVHFTPNWRVLQASAGHAIGEPVDPQALRSVALSVEHTQAFDALVEGTPEVRERIAQHLTCDVSPLPEVFASTERAALTKRESEVLAALRTYPSVKEIAGALHVSPNTAKSHLRALYRKLGVHGREQALRVTATITL